MLEEQNIWALSTGGEVLRFYYWYSTNNYEDPDRLVKDLQSRGYVLKLEYYESVLTSFQIIGIKKQS